MFFSADLEGIFLPSVDRIINYFFEGMFTFLILLVMHIIFQTLEWWAGISSKGGPTNQTQCDFGFISLLKHLVLISARLERGSRHIKALPALSPVFLSLPLYHETCCLQERNEVNSTTDTFTKTHFHVHEGESCVASFPRFQSGTPALNREGWGTGHWCLWWHDLLETVSP